MYNRHSEIELSEFKGMLEYWIKELRYSKSAKRTKSIYKKSAEIFLEYIEKEEPEQIDLTTVIDFRDYLDEKGLSSNTINLRLKTVNRIFKDFGYTDIKIDLLKDSTSNIAKDIITEDEFNLFIKTANKLGKKRMALLAETLAYTGARISEIGGLRRSDLKQRYYTIRNKGTKRYIFIPKKLNNKLIRYCRNNGIKETKNENPVIFHGRDTSDKMIDPSYIRREFKLIARKAGLENPERFHPHAFRHFFSFLYVNTPGTNPYWLSDILGHSTKGRATITDLYTRAGIKDYLKAVDLVEQTHRK